MKVSYCINCHKRLWQLKKTLPFNLPYTEFNKVDICILAYNDLGIKPYLEQHYKEYILDGRLKIKEHIDDYKPKDGSNYACGYTKHLCHSFATGDILFNLDADNFISTSHQQLLQLKDDEILINLSKNLDGRNGRIGIHRSNYIKVGGYEDKGRADDGLFIKKCIEKLKLKLKIVSCPFKPIQNEEEVL